MAASLKRSADKQTADELRAVLVPHDIALSEMTQTRESARE
jgi:hypothetical protein